MRVVAGLMRGTVGFARDKRVYFKYHPRKRSRVCFCISSANVNVPTKRRSGVFSQFAGLSRRMPKAKLKLALSRAVMRGLKKRVKIRSRIAGKSAF